MSIITRKFTLVTTNNSMSFTRKLLKSLQNQTNDIIRSAHEVRTTQGVNEACPKGTHPPTCAKRVYGYTGLSRCACVTIYWK